MERKGRLVQLLIVLVGILLVWLFYSQVDSRAIQQDGAPASTAYPVAATPSPPAFAGADEQPVTRTMPASSPESLAVLTPLPSTKSPAAPTVPMLALIDGIGGLTRALAIKDDLLYVGEGSGLTVFDVADGQHLVRVNHVMLPGYAEAIQIDNGRAYISSRDAGLLILDLKDPRSPNLIGSFAAKGHGHSLQVAGDWVYLGQYNGPFQIIAVNDPTHPSLVGIYQQPNTSEMAVSGSRAYLIVDKHGPIILDLTNPTKPTLLGRYNSMPEIADIAVHDNLVYLATNDGLTILDLTDLDAPITVKSYPIQGGVYDILLNEQVAFVTGQSGNVTMLDVSDPTLPQPIGRFHCMGCMPNFVHLVVYKDRVFIAQDDNGIQIIDLSVPAMPRELSVSFNTLRRAMSTQVIGTNAFVAAGDEGLLIYDISQPHLFSLLGVYNTPIFAYQVAVSGTVAYIAGSGGVQIIDVSNVQAPRLLAAVTNVQAINLQIVGERLYVSGVLDSELTIIDVGDPSNPRILGAIGIAFGGSVVVRGKYAFVAEASNGLTIYDVSNPAAITHISAYRGGSEGHHQLDASALALDVVGSIAYLATNTIGSAGLQIIDVSDLSHPRLLGYAPTSYTDGRNVQVIDHVAYVAAGNAGVYTFDVRDPAHPILLHQYNTPDIALDVEVAGERLYVSAESAGLLVFGGGDGITRTPQPTLTPPIRQPTAVPIATPTVSTAETALTLDLVGAIDGAASSIILSGTLAYLETSSGLTVLDLSDPIHPTVLSRIPQITMFTDLLIVGTQGYLAKGYSGLAILDMSDPLRPKLRGKYRPLSPYPGEFKNPVNDVAVVGTYAYVTAGQSGLLILDVGTPDQPVLVSSINVGPYVSDVQLVGDRAYVSYLVPSSRMTNARAGLGVVDVSNPASPSLLGSYNMPDSSWADYLYVDGSYAFLLSNNRKLRSFDVSDPARIIPLSEYDLGSPSYPYFDRHLAYILTSDHLVQILDISDPLRMRHRSTLLLPEAGKIIKDSSGLALITSKSGLMVFDITNPDAPQLISTYDTVPAAGQLAVAGDRVLIAAEKAGLRIFDQRDPNHPLLVGSYQATQPMDEVAVAGDLIVATAGDALLTLKASTAQALTLVGTYALPGRAAAVELRNGLAYVALMSHDPYQSAVLLILNLRDPANPAFVGQVSIKPMNHIRLQISGTRAYLLYPEGWSVVDISDPSAPQLLGSFHEQLAKAFVVNGDRGYLLGHTLKIVDLRDITHPTLIASYPIFALDMALHEQHLYLIENGRLTVLDVSDPQSLREIGFYEGLMEPSAITIVDDKIYVSSSMGGVYILARGPISSQRSTAQP